MTLRKTAKWFVLIVLLLVLVGSGYGFWLWNQSDELLRQIILKKTSEIAPGWDIRIGRTRFDWLSRRRVYIYDVELKAEGQQVPVAVLPEVVLMLDAELLEEQQEIDITKINLRQTRIDLSRDSAGSWNWEGLPPLKDSKKSLPEIAIEDGTIRVQLAQTDGSTPVTIVLQHSDVDLIPSGKREFRVQGTTQIQQAGKLNFNAKWNVDEKTWMATGDIHDVTTSGEMISLAASTSPHLRSRLQRIDAALKKIAGLPVHENAGANGASDIPDLGMGGTLDIDFRISRIRQDAEAKFAVVADVRQGYVTNPALPFPLHEIVGKILWDNDELDIQSLTAKFGTTRLELNGKVERTATTTPARMQLNLTDVVLDSKLRAHMPASWQKIYDSLRPSGHVDASVIFNYDGQGKLTYEDLLITAKSCTCLHRLFEYPLRGVTGTITQSERGLEVDFDGYAGRRPVSIEGYLVNPGPQAEAKFEIHVEQLPLDETFVAACVDPSHQATLKALGLKGFVKNADCTLYRPAGPKRKFQIQVDAQVDNATLEFKHFQWRLNRLSGHVIYDSLSGTWDFINLKAVHGDAAVSGAGRYVRQDPRFPGVLDLEVTALGAHLNNDLEHALPGELREVWGILSPKGRLNVVTKIHWVPGSPAVITIPKAEVYNGSLVLTPFPYPLDDVSVKAKYADGHVELASFSGKHGNSRVSAKKGFAECDAKGDWVVRCEGLEAEDVDPSPNSMFRRAFGQGTAMWEMLNELNPQGLISLFGMLEFRGNKHHPELLTAAWDQRIVFSGNSVSVGVDLKQVSGEVTARGTLDQYGYLKMDQGNRIDLDHAELWGYSLSQISGPYQLIDRQLIVGSRGEFNRQRKRAVEPIAAKDRLTAQAIGGVISLELEAVLREETSYRLRATLSNGSMGEYAKRYMAGVRNLRGIIDGWIDLTGRGDSANQISGRGQLQISRAALYELPVLVKIFKVISFTPPDNTAFRYAIADFDVKHEKFLFKSIDLVGDTIRLRGRGTARFDGLLDLDFYSMLPRQRRTIPFLDVVVGEATKGWVGVKVTGQVGSPDARMRAAPLIEESVKQFLKAFETRPPGVNRRLIAPPFAPTRPAPYDARRRRPVR